MSSSRPSARRPRAGPRRASPNRAHRSARGPPRRPRVPTGAPTAFLTIRELVSTPAVLVAPDAPLLDAAMLMRTHEISGLPVVDRRGRVVGIVSQRDLARLLVGTPRFAGIQGLLDVVLVGLTAAPEAGLPRARAQLERTPVRAVMSRPAIVTHPDEPVGRAAATMRTRRINRLPVVEEGRLLGVVTRGDLVGALARPARPSGRR